MVINPKILNNTQLPHLLCCIHELGKVAVILGNSPQGLGRVDTDMVPLHEFLCRCKVLGDGLLGEDMFPCQERFLDEFWLD